MAHQICNTHWRKLLIFVDWPLIQWNLEMFLQNAGFNIVTIRAIHKNLDRDDCVNTFNDPNRNLQILVTSLNISATAINLQEDCSDVIFVDTPSNGLLRLMILHDQQHAWTANTTSRQCSCCLYGKYTDRTIHSVHALNIINR